MTFIHHKNGTKDRYCPVTGETLTIKTKNGRITVETDNEESIYNKAWKQNN